MERQDAGFTLIELLAVVCLVAIIAITAMPQFSSLLDQSRQQAAKSLTASAQSQLSLEYARRSMTGQDLTVAAQTVCDMVSLSAAGQTVAMTCSGNLSDANVPITATVDGQSASANWSSPQGG